MADALFLNALENMGHCLMVMRFLDVEKSQLLSHFSQLLIQLKDRQIDR